MPVVSYRNSTSNHNGPSGRLFLTPLYLIEILHQTTTFVGGVPLAAQLYLIEILHQTTTQLLISLEILVLYLIEILHQTTTIDFRPKSAPMLYLIEILHQTTTLARAGEHVASCILSKFYIKPQRGTLPTVCPTCCILSKFYIKPQRLDRC